MEINLEDVINSIKDDMVDTYFNFVTEELVYVEEDYIYSYGSNNVEDISELNNGEYIKLPNKDYLDTYGIMEAFCDEVDDQESKEWLKESIKGSGAFRRFKASLSRLHLEDQYRDYLNKEIRNAAIDWCNENGFEYYELEEINEEEYEVKKDNEYKLIEIKDNNKHTIVNLVMDFRDYLDSLKGYKANNDDKSIKNEINYYLESNYPIYAISLSGLMIGYCVLRIEADVVWLESIYVKKEYRNKGIGKILFKKAEEEANKYGNDTLYNYVHPNNDLMFAFLKSMNYDVLNLIEVRKAYKEEELNKEYIIGNNTFKYKSK